MDVRVCVCACRHSRVPVCECGSAWGRGDCGIGVGVIE